MVKHVKHPLHYDASLGECPWILTPVDLKIVWEFTEDEFFSLTRGYVQRLANGNTLIIETDDGRALEITPDKELVWEYWHPEFTNETQRMVINRMTRYPKEFIDALI